MNPFGVIKAIFDLIEVSSGNQTIDEFKKKHSQHRVNEVTFRWGMSENKSEKKEKGWWND